MKKEEVVGYVVMESLEPVKPQNVQVIRENGLFYVRFDATLQSFNTRNRNGRIYEGEAMMKSLFAEHIMELQARQSWCGEAGHPMEDDVKRILTIDPKLISHRIVKHTADRNFCKATIETLCTDYGIQMAKLIMQGMEVAFSLRALAPLTKVNGQQIMKSKAHIVTYDWVILPSHKEAYQDTSKPVEKIVKSLESAGNIMTESAIPVTEEALKDFIMTESTNVKLVSNLSDVALESLCVTPDLKTCILKEGNQTFHVALEDRIKDDISKYMRSL